MLLKEGEDELKNTVTMRAENTTSSYHFIFILDESGSMKGKNFEAL